MRRNAAAFILRAVGAGTRTVALRRSFRAPAPIPFMLTGLALLLQSHGLGALRESSLLMSAAERFGEAVRAGDAPPPETLAAAIEQRQP